MIGTRACPEIQKELIDNLKSLPLGCPVRTVTGFCQVKAKCFWFSCLLECRKEYFLAPELYTSAWGCSIFFFLLIS